MTCIRPTCNRPRDRGVHCRKCHQRFKVIQHNARQQADHRYDWRGRDLGDSVTFPAYEAVDMCAYLDQMIGAWPDV